MYTYIDISNIVTNCTFDWGSSMRIHECCPAVPTTDMVHLIGIFKGKSNNKSVNNLACMIGNINYYNKIKYPLMKKMELTKWNFMNTKHPETSLMSYVDNNDSIFNTNFHQA